MKNLITLSLFFLFISKLHSLNILTIDNDLFLRGYINFYEVIDEEQRNWIQGFTVPPEDLGFVEVPNSSKDIIEVDFNNHLQNFESHSIQGSFAQNMLYYIDNPYSQQGWGGQNVKFEFHVDDYSEFNYHSVSSFIRILEFQGSYFGPTTLAETSIISSGYYAIEAAIPPTIDYTNVHEIQIGFKIEGLYQNVANETGYIKISSVPETSTYALILGAVALGFAIKRRE